MQVTPLRPGLLVSLKTSLTGNIKYRTQEIEAEHTTEDGTRRARWETERTIDDPAEHEAAVVARGKARSAITAICSQSSFGLLCPQSEEPRLTQAIAEARRIAAAFNDGARLTAVNVYVIVGRVASDDAEAVRAISAEMRDHLAQMEAGIRNLDVEAIREAANKAREIGGMLAPDAAERVKAAIDAARSVARRIVTAGETAAAEIDMASLRKITEARSAFLDLDDAPEPAAPEAQASAIDLAPVDCAAMPVQAAAQITLEF